MDITNISSFWMCLTILAQNVFEHFVSVYKITPCTCFDVLLATFLCENLVCLSHYRAGDTTSGAADEPHLARDVTY